MRAVLAGIVVFALATVSAAAGRQPTFVAHCNLELVRDGTFYRPAHLPKELFVAGEKLARAGVVRCERAVTCKRSGACSYDAGKVLASTHVERVRGIDSADAVFDPLSRRVYADPSRCFLQAAGGLHCETPSPPPSQWPPMASILTARATVPMGFGNEFCWSTATGDDSWVQNCPLFLAPWLRPRAFPVIAAASESSVRIGLGFDPYAVTIGILGPDRVYVSETVTPSRTIAWRVPLRRLYGTAYLDVRAVRLFAGQPRDFVDYAARIRIPR